MALGVVLANCCCYWAWPPVGAAVAGFVVDSTFAAAADLDQLQQAQPMNFGLLPLVAEPCSLLPLAVATLVVVVDVVVAQLCPFDLFLNTNFLDFLEKANLVPDCDVDRDFVVALDSHYHAHFHLYRPLAFDVVAHWDLCFFSLIPDFKVLICTGIMVE